MEHCLFTSQTPRPTAAPSPPGSPSSPGTIASTFALRGLSLRPVVYNAPPVFQRQIDIRPQIYIPVPAAVPADDAPDNVHPLQR